MPKNNKNMENDIEHDGIRQRYSLFYLMRNYKISRELSQCYATIDQSYPIN